MKKLFVTLVFILTLLCGTAVASAAPDPNVMLVNPAPNSTVFSNNLLISVKLTQPKTIKVTVYEEKQQVNGTLSAVNVNTLTMSNGAINSASFTPVPITMPATFSSTNNLSFYTKQVNNLKPGLYRIQIETLDSANKATHTNNSYVVVKEKAEEEAKIFDTPQSGTMQFLQNLLKTIFGN